MVNVTDAALKKAVNRALSGANLTEMTLRKTMQAAAEILGCTVTALNPRKKAVRDFIALYLEEHPQGGDDDDESGSEEEGSEEGSDEEEEEEEEAVPAAAEKPKKKPRKRAAKAEEEDDEEEVAVKWKPVVLSGLSKAVVLSDPLAELLGVRVMGRSGIQKAIIAYVKEHNLQDESDKRNISTDAALKAIFDVDTFTFFGLSKLISSQVTRAEDSNDEALKQEALDADEETLARLKRERQAKIDAGEKPHVSAAAKRKLKEAGGKKKKRKRAPSDGPPSTTGLNAPMTLSDQLSEVCGGESVMSRPQVVKALWAYIKENDLKDPSNGRNIICDDKLSGLFDGEKQVNGFGMNKYLSKHLTKIPKAEV
jgi:upstream activation factor subunit UAF30